MKILYCVTDETVRLNVSDAVSACLEDNQIAFPDDSAREAFETDLFETICDRVETESYYGSPSDIDYEEEVLDMAKLYNYLTED